jgi:hypothetical protein
MVKSPFLGQFEGICRDTRDFAVKSTAKNFRLVVRADSSRQAKLRCEKPHDPLLTTADCVLSAPNSAQITFHLARPVLFL